MNTWSRLNDSEPELYLTSQGVDEASIIAAVVELIERMVANRERDAVEDARLIFFYVNATNGYVAATWHQADESVTGTWKYELQLPARWRASVEDDARGSIGFDEDVFQALRRAVERVLPMSCSAKARTEMSDVVSVS